MSGSPTVAANRNGSPQTPNIVLLYLTYNRVAYTKLSLPRLLEDSTEKFELVIWDNGSNDGTVDFLKAVRDPRVADIILRPHNEGQAPALNLVWGQSGGNLCGKVDNDCLVTPGWTRKLAPLFGKIANLGGVGCWHFMPEDFDARLAARKIRTFGDYQIVEHPHIGGSAFLTKRSDFLEHGPIKPDWLLTTYWTRLAVRGRLNGWLYPLIHQEHMDDPRSQYCALDEQFDLDAAPFVCRAHGLNTRTQFDRWLRDDAFRIVTSPSGVKYHIGWRRYRHTIPRILHRRAKSFLRRLRAFRD